MYAAFAIGVFLVWKLLYAKPSAKRQRELLKQKNGQLESSLENARFMTEKEKDNNFPSTDYKSLRTLKKDGICVGAEMKGGSMKCYIAPPMHGLIIGATGSGKTTTFVNPVIQVIASTSAGSSMICTDPKGELFAMHTGYLSERGWKCMVLDLREPYNSFRWNPLSDLYDRYQQYLHFADELFAHDDDVNASGLKLNDPIEKYGAEWYEFDGKAFADSKILLNKIKMNRQKIYDEIYEDLNDLVSVLCPIESESDPVWEKGARSIIMAVILAMLEDSEFPELNMTKDKVCFYNVNKVITNNEDDYKELRDYFKGRPKLAKSVNLSKQVLAAAAETLSSYMSIAFDKMSMFNDEGICALTSATDIDPTIFADQATALFLKIPDEKDTRHALAGVFILSIYKALIKKASSREDLSLPRNVYFLLDEFGNMPKIDKFDKMITVGRSRKIWFQMIVQSYAQLGNVYGDKVADIIKSNCGLKLFIGSNDIDTCEEFSKLCGNMTVSTNSVSSQLSATKEAEYNVSMQVQTRPLIYPSELQKLNNKESTGNAILVSFGNHALKTKYTPSYKCSLYKFGKMKDGEMIENAFFGDEVFYDIAERNYIVLDAPNEEKPEIQLAEVKPKIELDET
jgi:type IV secretion system protein VirD4